MKLKRKKKTIIPKNITKQNIDMFNQALGTDTTQIAGGEMTGGGSTAACGESLEESFDDFDYDDYSEEEIEEALNALKDDYIKKTDMLKDFFRWNRDMKVERWIRDVFDVDTESDISEDQAEEIIDYFLFESGTTIDETFIRKYLVDHFWDETKERRPMIELKYCFDEDDFEYEPSMDDIGYVLEEQVEMLGALRTIRILEENCGEDKLKELEECGYKPYTFSDNDPEDNEDLLDELIGSFTEEELINIFDLEEYLKKYCEHDAYDCYEDGKLYEKDPYAYNGVSRSDFI